MREFIGFAILLVAVTMAGAGFATPPPDDSIAVLEDSRLWIEGASTVNEWSCSAGSLEGTASAMGDVTAESRDRPQARLSVSVASFDCGGARMNRDFVEALKADDHPRILFELTEATVLEASGAEDGWHLLQVRGDLTIAGTTKEVEAEAWGRQTQGGEFRVRGNKPLTMTEFGVKPPVALLGLVKAHDRIDVHFDLLAAPERLATR